LIAVSIVSHGHGVMVDRLVRQLRACPEVRQVLVTRNIPEASPIGSDGLVFVTENKAPKGFGANHNAAFAHCREPFFCVLNPDIELAGNPFPALLGCLQDDGIALAAPLIFSPDGRIEDSARHFPNLLSLLSKALGGHDGRYAITPGQEPLVVDWVAGMFMVFSGAAYARLGGFDERYFLYYEDVDVCARAGHAGMKVVVCPSVSAIHDAAAESKEPAAPALALGQHVALPLAILVLGWFATTLTKF